MPSLREMQVEISNAIRSEAGEFTPMLLRDDGIEPAQRLQIYRNNHRLSSRATLLATYPVIERLGGADWFRQSAAHYIASFPSTSGDLQNLGEHYPEFLRGALADTPYAYFADVATLEWAYQCVLTTAERPPVAIAKLRIFSPDDYDRLVFVPRPALRIVESPYPLLAIWQANQPDTVDADTTIQLDGVTTRVLVLRRSGQVQLRNLSADCCCLLREFLLGRPLCTAAQAAAAAVDSVDLNATLAEVVGLETIADIELTSPTDDNHPERRPT